MKVGDVEYQSQLGGTIGEEAGEGDGVRTAGQAYSETKARLKDRRVESRGEGRSSWGHGSMVNRFSNDEDLSLEVQGCILHWLCRYLRYFRRLD